MDPSTAALLASLRARIAQRPMLVVGNGPSLNTTPLDSFAGIHSIGMNKIDLLFPRVSWRPTMIVCVNNLVARQHRSAFEVSPIPVFLAWKCRWFLNAGRNPQLHFFRNRPTADFSQDIMAGVGSLSPTVTYTALQFAYYLQADPVILVGVDHRFDTDPGHQGIERRQTQDPNHFSPDYFQPGQYWGLPDLRGSEASYIHAKEVFDRAQRRIFDATIDGNLKVFPKISISEALNLVSN